MNYCDVEIRERLGLGGDETWEFKQIKFSGNRPTSPTRNEFADEITAFANANGGVILCGVTDDGSLQGMNSEQLKMVANLISEVATDTIEPALKINVYNRLLDGKAFNLVEVPKSKTVHDRNGTAYTRVGPNKRRLSCTERITLAQNREQSSYLGFDRGLVPDTGFKTLQENLWEPLLSVTAAANPERGLKSLRLISTDDKGIDRATVAGILLCTNTPELWLPQATIMATQYRGIDRASGQLDSQEIVGPLNLQITNAVKFIQRNMRVSALKLPARLNIPEYSLGAVFEAIVNAVVHRDYSLRQKQIRLSMFKDRLEIDSPGSLPNGMTIESMDDSQSTRNEVLASIFGRISVGDLSGTGDRQYLMERRGDGVSIIKNRTFEVTGQFPNYELVGSSNLKLTIPAANLEFNPAPLTISVHSDDIPLEGVSILTLFPNNTFHTQTTNNNGEATFNLHSTNLPMTVYVAKHGFSGCLINDWLPANEGLVIELKKKTNGGSIIFPNDTGHLPGLNGRLNPILDTSYRTYLYADNIAIQDGQQQPVNFRFGHPIKLTDANGKEMSVTILMIKGRSVLLEYNHLD